MEDLRQSITIALNKSIKPDELLPTDAGYSDAVLSMYDGHFDYKADNKYYKRPTGESRSDHVHRRLGHIPANPNNVLDTKALLESYVYLKPTGIPSYFVNECPESADKLIHELIETAKYARKYVLNQTIDRSECKFTSILHGDRGSGKTFFVNHVFSKNSKKLDYEKVLWVRLDLFDEFASERYDDNVISDWIYAQTTKIVFRYYDPNSNQYDQKNLPLDLKHEVLDYINSSVFSDEEKLKLQQKLQKWINIFYSKREEALSELVPGFLGNFVFDLVLDKGYSFIVVLDGLDKLEATEYYSNRFTHMLSSLRSLIAKFRGAAFLVVTRTNNLRQLFNINNCVSPYRHQIDECWRLVDIPTDRIVSDRIDYIKKEIPLVANKLSDAEKNEWLNDWPDHIDLFYTYLKEAGFDYKDRANSLSQMLNKNKRAQMQVMQLKYFDYLEMRREKSYLLIESLCRSGFKYPPRPYIYIRKSNELNRHIHDKVFDHHLLPSIFMYPMVCFGDTSEHKESTHKYSFLCGVRILQIVYAHDKLVKSGNGSIEPMLSKELSEICNKLFAYPKDIVAAIVEEFGEYEFLRINHRSSFTAEKAMYKLCGTDKMEYLLKALLQDVGYLNLASMRIFLKPAALKDQNNARINPFVKAVQLDPDSTRSFDDWVAYKIINAISTFRLIDYANQHQYYDFHSKLAEIKNERLVKTVKQAYIDGMFNITTELKNNISSIIWQILGSLQSKQKIEYIKNQVNKYLNKW